MPSIHRWWHRHINERYWLEVTDRPDIGINLKAPITNEKGKDFWSYSLLRHVNPGDVIFHYDKNSQAITARSIAVGETWNDIITWAAHGTYARDAGIEPHPREGLYLGLEEYGPLQVPVTLDQIRASASTINARLEKLGEAVSGPLYFPFERSTKRETRPLQGYLFKLPSFLLDLFKNLGESLTVVSPTHQGVLPVGVAYRKPPADQAVAERDPFAVDPSIVERGIRGHVATQNQLAATVASAGMLPRSPSPIEPNFDLAWSDASTIWVAEVKSLTAKNEEKQLRLGLGQVLRYAHLLARLHSVTVCPVLVAERQPTSDDWTELCRRHNVLLLWPPFQNSSLRMTVKVAFT